MPWYVRVSFLTVLAWYGCTMTTDLPEGSGAATTGAGGQGGSPNPACNTIGSCVDRCALLGCTDCDGAELVSHCTDLKSARAACICNADCEEIRECLERECFDANDCADGGPCDANGQCSNPMMPSASSTGTGGNTNTCCGAHMTAGCSNDECEGCVCRIMESCCADTWSQACVDQAGFLCAIQCVCGDGG